MSSMSRPVPSRPRPHMAHWPRQLPTELTLPETSLWTNLEISARRYPDKAATIFFGARLSFSALKAQTEAIAGWLQARGVAKGDRVLLYMQNSPQFIAAFYGILRADAVVVPVNPMNRADEFVHYITDAQCRIAICGAELAARVVEANASLPQAQQLAHVLAARYADALPARFPHPDDAPPPGLAPLFEAPPLPAGVTDWNDALAEGRVPGPHLAVADDLAVMPYTSGTTGFPKGCMHTHRTVMHNTVGGGVWGQSNADSISLSIVPMFHVTGMQYGMNGPLYSGATVVILPRWDRDTCGGYLSRYRITHWALIPTMLIDLLASPRMHEFDLSSLVRISGGGAAMPEAVAERLRDEFGLHFLEGYGLTETMAPTHANPPDRPKLQCLGIPVFGTDARVIDPQTRKELGPNEIGEIIVHGPQVFKGYWGRPEATEEAFIDFDGKRFFRTGDLGRVDEEGYFFITDRLKRMINASGYKVWPAEVENLMYRHPDIQEACIIGTRDAYRGETVKAVVVLRAHARGKTTAEDIIAWSQQHMAAYKYPRVVEFVETLPKSGTGKVMWRMLQDQENARTSA